MTLPERDIAQILETLDLTAWEGPARTNMPETAVRALESGKILYFPRLAFELSKEEQSFLTPAIADARTKNISYDPSTHVMKHATGTPAQLAALKRMIRRYGDNARALVALLAPEYAGRLEPGRTSFRPAEIAGRRLSPAKDDTRLHIDAFPSTPTGGKRILRVFTNVNPKGDGRDWRIGDSFEHVARTFANRVPEPSPFRAFLMKAVGLTKAHRTPYDHFMLNIHDTMKADEAYQSEAIQNSFSFPPGSTWIAYTDRVSHAAMAGQHLFEQTFYLPVEAMIEPAQAPLHILERVLQRALL